MASFDTNPTTAFHVSTLDVTEHHLRHSLSTPAYRTQTSFRVSDAVPSRHSDYAGDFNGDFGREGNLQVCDDQQWFSFTYGSAEPDGVQNSVATKIQAAYRGHRARRALAGLALSAGPCKDLAQRTYKDPAYIKNNMRMRRQSLSLPRSDEEQLAQQKLMEERKKKRTPREQWARLREKLLPLIGQRGLRLRQEHWLEVMDKKHRYGSNLRVYYEYWLSLGREQCSESFFKWLDEGAGKDTDLPECRRSKLEKSRLVYLTPEQVAQYEVAVDNGHLVYVTTRELVETEEDDVNSQSDLRMRSESGEGTAAVGPSDSMRSSSNGGVAEASAVGVSRDSLGEERALGNATSSRGVSCRSPYQLNCQRCSLTYSTSVGSYYDHEYDARCNTFTIPEASTSDKLPVQSSADVSSPFRAHADFLQRVADTGKESSAVDGMRCQQCGLQDPVGLRNNGSGPGPGPDAAAYSSRTAPEVGQTSNGPDPTAACVPGPDAAAYSSRTGPELGQTSNGPDPTAACVPGVCPKVDLMEVDRNQAAGGTREAEGGKGTGKPIKAAKEKDKYIYVMDTQHRLYVARKVRYQFHHSSFLQGAPLLAAGGIAVRQGVLKRITAMSGHYHPTARDIDHLIDALYAMGVDMTHVTVCRTVKAAKGPKTNYVPNPNGTTQA